MERVVQVARETGYLDGVQAFRGADLYGHFPPDKVVALCTGSQGEPRAALARIARDDHPDITLTPGDRVIFSSRTIPGNEKAVSGVINGLIDQGIEVITDRTHLIHVSGHPRIGEVEELLGWVKPKILIPVHGEALHLSEHAAIGRRLGIPRIVSCRNGDLVELAPGTPGIVDKLPHGRVYKDGVVLVGADSRTIADRRRLSFVGMVTVALALTDKGVLAAAPEVELLGIPERGKDGTVLADVAMEAVEDTFENLPRQRRRDPDAVAEAVKRGVRGAIAQQWGKKPICSVHVLSV
jgi:ribonuclease J